MLSETAAIDNKALVLYVDDDPLSHRLVEVVLLGMGLEIASAFNATDGANRARAGDVQLILLDNDLGDNSTGISVLKMLKSGDDLLRAIPVIMVTGDESSTVLTDCFAAGAVDYVRKPFAPEELKARVNSVLERQRLLSELTKAARTDRLTGLANRATLMERLTGSLDRWRADSLNGVAVMFLDFDGFKIVNDTHGHDIGDMLLQAIAGRLLHNLRATSEDFRGHNATTVARFGGDEFVVVLTSINTVNEVRSVGERLLRALERPYNLAGVPVTSTVSIGTALAGPHCATPSELLRAADTAMYEAKARGKACQVILGDELLSQR